MTRSRLTDERTLSKWQLMLVHSPFLRWLARPLLPKGWTAGSFQTTGEVDAQRQALQTLGTRLAVLSIFSFLCKSASAATSYFYRGDTVAFDGLESVIFLFSVLSVQGLPSLITLLLLYRFHFGRGSSGQASIMQSLLTHQGTLAVRQDGRDAEAASHDYCAENSATDGVSARSQPFPQLRRFTK